MTLYAVFTVIGFTLFAICLIGLVWSVRSGQFDDLETPAFRMLIDDEPIGPPAVTPATQAPKEQKHP